MTTATSPVRLALVAEFTPEQIATVTRGLTLPIYVRAFEAGYASHEVDADLDARLRRYDARTAAHEGAWLDGNTYGDEGAEGFIAARIRGEI